MTYWGSFKSSNFSNYCNCTVISISYYNFNYTEFISTYGANLLIKQILHPHSPFPALICSIQKVTTNVIPAWWLEICSTLLHMLKHPSKKGILCWVMSIIICKYPVGNRNICFVPCFSWGCTSHSIESSLYRGLLGNFPGCKRTKCFPRSSADCQRRGLSYVLKFFRGSLTVWLLVLVNWQCSWVCSGETYV